MIGRDRVSGSVQTDCRCGSVGWYWVTSGFGPGPLSGRVARTLHVCTIPPCAAATVVPEWNQSARNRLWHPLRSWGDAEYDRNMIPLCTAGARGPRGLPLT